MTTTASPEDRFGTFGSFAIDYVKDRFQCDAFVIGVFGPPPDYAWRPLVASGVALNPECPLLLDFAAQAFAATPPRGAPRPGRAVSATEAPIGMSGWLDGQPQLEKAGSLLLTGLTDANERYLALLFKNGISTADYQKLAVSRLQSCVPFQSFVRGLCAATRLSRHIEALERGYDAMHFGALFADERGAVLFLNDCARQIMNKAFGKVPETASGRNAQVTLATSHFIASLLEGAMPGLSKQPVADGHASTAWRKLPHFEDRIPFYLVPLSSGRPDRTTTWVIFPDPSHEMEPELFLNGLGLTASETRLASHIISGKSLKDASSELALSQESARTYLKRVFSKLGVSRQAELVSTVARLCAPVRRNHASKTPPRQSFRNNGQEPKRH